MAKNRKNKSPLDSKIYRHRRRIRSVILSYIAAIIILAIIGAGLFFVVKTGSKMLADKKAELQAEQEAMEAEALAVQESIEAAEAERIAELEARTSRELEEAESTETETEEYSEKDVLDEVVDTYISTMSLEEKVAGLFIITPEALTSNNKVIKAGDGTKEALEKYPVGGLVYFSQNIQSGDQVKEMLGNTVSFSKYPLFLCVKEEPGDGSQMRKTLKLDSMDSAAKIGESGDSNNAYEAYKSMGEYLVEYGFNVDLSLVADIQVDGVESKLGDRVFGSDVTNVSNMIDGAIRGLNESGISACITHFPGQGTADADPAKGLATSDRSSDDFLQNDIAVFNAGIEAGADMVMVGNFIAPALTGDEATPCTLSKAVMTDLLRGEYQYDGVIITDELSMPAIKDYYGSGEAAVKALKSGADMLLMPENFEEAYKAVVDAVNDGTISEQRINDSLARVYRIKYRSTVED